MFLALSLATAVPVEAETLGSGSLAIAGTRLTVSPESQTVPFDVSTIVETQLEGYDAAEGMLPQGLRVRGDFTGPEVDGVLVLETVPNEPFQIPRLRLEGEYVLDNIRLVEDEVLLGYAEPRAVTVLVTQVLVTSVRSRPLTLDEIRHFGLVIDEDSFTTLNLTFGFGVDPSNVIEYNMPLIYRHYGPEGRWESPLASVPLPQFGEGTAPPSARFIPPQLIPFEIEIEYEEPPEIPYGGCDPANPQCRALFPPGPPLVGVILFPTDIRLLHQFFSVVLMVQNGAPDGDPLVLRDVVTRINLPQGLRQAATEPPTPLGVPVPVRVPGPDGELGTGDDLHFIVAQATGDAEFLVEGLKEGTHVVEFDIAGILEGLPGGRVERVTGRARGAVIVRDPTLSVTISHPHTVRAHQEYSLFLTISNNGNAPVNQLSLKLPASGLSGVELVEGEVHQKTISELLPGDSEVVEFELESQLTGKVVAGSIKSGSAISPDFEWGVSVGDDIPLSPNTLNLPRSSNLLPEELVRAGLALIGLGHSAATAPQSLLSVGSIRVGREVVNERIYRLAQAGRHVKLGEELFESVAILSSEFSGARDFDWEWDRLRRETLKGGQMAAAFAAVMSAEESDPETAFDRFAAATHFLHPQAVMAEGSGVELEVRSRTSGKRASGSAADPDDPQRSRELPFAEIYDLGDAELATLTLPEEGGYRALIRHPSGGSTDLHLLVPDDAGSLRVVRWSNVSLSVDAVAFVDFAAADTSFTLWVDEFGDGVLDADFAGSVSVLSPRPFEALAAVQNASVDPSGHVIDVLLSSDVDLRSLLPRDPGHFTIPGKVSNGGLIAMEMDSDGGLLGQAVVENPLAGLQNSRIVRVVFDNPLSPLVDHELTIRDLLGVEGEELVQQTLTVETTVTQPGIQVEGQVIGPDGQPVPFAEVALFEYDPSGIPPNDLCIEHRTATVVADAAGRFHFDYVRQTECGDVFRIAARDLIDPKWGEARGRVRFVGSTQAVDVIMIGRGTVRGRVTYEDGTVPRGVRVVAHNPVFDEGRLASVDADGNYLANDVMVGTVTLAAHDPEGRIVYQTIEIPQAGSVVERDLVILRLDTPAPQTGEVRGTVYELDGTTPAYNAYVALYVDGQLIASERSGGDGSFDFGVVPAGVAELEAFDGVTGRSGAQHFFEITADQMVEVDLFLRDDRGTVQGHVYRQLTDGSVTPVAGAVVWAEGTPFNTTTDGSGFYLLEDVFAGNWSIQAADLDTGETVSASVSVTSAGGVVDRDLYFFEDLPSGGITGEVLDYDGSPVEGARVHLAGGYYSVRWTYEVNTNELGRFAIPDIGPGIYGVHAISGTQDGGLAFANVRFPGDTPFVTVQFRKGTIRVRTTEPDELGEPQEVPSTLVYRTTKVVPEWDIVVLDKDFSTVEIDGSHDFSDVLVGPYEIYAYNQFHATQRVQSSLEVHGQVNEHTFEFEENGTIRGVVYDFDGVTPVAGAEVSLEGGLFEPGGYVLTTDAEGRFNFEFVPIGSYAVKASWEGGVVFRRQRVSVYMSHSGGEIDVEVVLPVQGSVDGFVQDADFNAVPGAVVTLSEHNYPYRVMVANADEEGFFQFDNIFAGEVSLRAQAPALGGIGGKSTVTIGFEGQKAYTIIELAPVGEVVGRVINPETGAPVPGARAVLCREGFFDSITTDENGEFRFLLLPLGHYVVDVFDPTTGRRGKSWTEVVDNGHVAHADVTLEVRGEVDGKFYDVTEASPIPGTTVKLVSRGLTWFTTYSSTDEEGYFEFLGIPEGEFILSAFGPTRRRQARATGEIEEEDQRVAVDLILEPFANVAGQVLTPDGTAPFENVNVRLVQPGPQSSFDVLVGATTGSQFAFDGVLPGAYFTLYVDEIGGLHRTVFSDIAGEPGSTFEVDLELPAIGSATIEVYDSFDQPVSGADVRVSNHHLLGFNRFNGSTGSDHVIHFDDLREGLVTAVATHPHNGLRGSASGTLVDEGEDVAIQVVLQPSGFVRGRALLADGFTPAAGAAVALIAGGKNYVQEADENGEFEFEAIALVSWTLIVQESFGPGTITRRGNLGANGEIDDLGDLVLDDADPYVVSITPPSGVRDLAPGTPIVVEFSEPIDVAALPWPGDWFQIRTLGTGISASLGAPTWSDENRRLSVTPQLASGTGYEIRITTGLIDLAGRTMGWLVRSTFTTADIIPPNVVDILPRNGEVQVPVDSVILITFSEPIVAGSLSGDGLQLHDLTDGRQLTTTFQLRSNERQVVLTPTTAQGTVYPDRLMQVRVKNAVDKAGNVMQGEVITTFWTPDETDPEISWTVPEENAVFTSGDDVPVAVTTSDNRGMDRVFYTIGDWTFTATAEPFSHRLLAPVVSVPTDVVITATAVDIFGNQTSVDRAIHVEPHVNGEPPVVEPGCWTDGDYVAPGFEIPLSYSITDDESIESYALVVDGERLEEVTPVDEPAASGTFFWRPPQESAGGTAFAVRVEARDFAGNVGFVEASMKVPDPAQGEVMLLPTTQGVNPNNHVGDNLYLAHGVFTFSGSPQLSGLTLMRGAVVRENFGGPFAPAVDGTVMLQDGSRIEVANAELTASGTVTVRCGAAIDVTAGGYGGGLAPEWVAPSTPNAGGSHGGLGLWDVAEGVAGEIYDSVYRPSLGGGGGAPSGSGGGVIVIDTPHLILEGELMSRGTGPWDSGGAGGTVVVRAATLAGGPIGKIDVSGADAGTQNGEGGGGRVALLVDDFMGFDPADQVLAFGGGRHGEPPYAGPGTVLVKGSSSIYGDLYLDAGVEEDGRVRFGPPVRLPTLGAGPVISLVDQGPDAVLSGEAAFTPRWLGSWVDLTDGTGAVLGSFEVAEITEAGDLVLIGAAGTTAAGDYAGIYRFDTLHLRNVELAAADPVRVSELVPQEIVRLPGGSSGLEVDAIELRADAAIDGLLRGDAIRVHAGVTVTPAAVSTLRFQTDGAMTVEAGAVVDVVGYGYAGGVHSGANSSEDGQAPPWVEPSRRNLFPYYSAGGSHGGKGGDPGDGRAGEVFNSVYRPALGGGGGTGHWTAAGGGGGGVIDIEAGELVLDGELRAAGESRDLPLDGTTRRYPGGGAGGSVLLRVEQLSGAGSIDVSGGDSVTDFGCSGSEKDWALGGGGGRTAIRAGLLAGFDPESQVKAWGGEYTCNGTDYHYAAPGTIYYADASSTYGTLLIDRGEDAGGADRVGRRPEPTELPVLGSDSATAWESAGPDALLAGADEFHQRWIGAWVELRDASGDVEGTFEAVELGADGRLRLAGAGGIAEVATYQGIYRFDSVDVRNGAGLETEDSVEGLDTLVFDGEAQVAGEIRASQVTVKSGATLTPANGGTLTFRVSGTMTVEAGAVVDVAGYGYAGGVHNSEDGQAPPWVEPSRRNLFPFYSAGGSHGGKGGDPGDGRAGEVFDSVYRPALGGGGGTGHWTAAGGAGGGVIDIEAGELVLDGELRATGESRNLPLDGTTRRYPGGGAGGSVLLRVDQLSGAGSIDVSGGDSATDFDCSGAEVNWALGGGGGRASIRAASLAGFDPGTQVKAWGGEYTCNGTEYHYAAPGTIYYADASSTYGTLLIDRGEDAEGVDRLGERPEPTELPELGSDSVIGWEASGSNAWLTGADDFHQRWVGAWVKLHDENADVLGTFEVMDLGADGRVLLAGAGAVAGATLYRGLYRFDAVDVRNGAGLEAEDTVEGLDTLVFEGETQVAAEITAANVTVKSGATLSPASGGTLTFRVSGKMTVEAGAVVDVAGYGYAGGVQSNEHGQAPPWVEPSRRIFPYYGAGGSHGGKGGDPGDGRAGEIFDSVYRPALGGGGGTGEWTTVGGAGGGVIDIEAGELVLDGELRATGESRVLPLDGSTRRYPGAGAGGSVRVRVDQLSGAGSIDVSGGDAVTDFDCAGGEKERALGGGGGRASIRAGLLLGFDPGTQVKAWGGEYTCNGTDFHYAAPGTIYFADVSSTYGTLLIDRGENAGDVDRVGKRPEPTELPALGTDSVTAWEAAGSDVWLTGSDAEGFRQRWVGAWVELRDSSTELLGTFEVVELDAEGRILLAGAGGIAGGTAYRGIYRFDAVVLRNGAGLEAADAVEGLESLVFEGEAQVAAEISSVDVTVKNGATLTPASGKTLKFWASGTMTVEAGAVVDVAGYGYAGGVQSNEDGQAPPWVEPSRRIFPFYGAGGSHGGKGGDPGDGRAGEIFDSVYRPALGGGGGTGEWTTVGGAGGGVIDIEAGELVLDGELRATGESRGLPLDGSTRRYPGAGAGGSVRVRVDQLSGAGSIDVSGGDAVTDFDCAGGEKDRALGGGGGRASIRADLLLGFDPGTQVKAWGGEYTCNGTDFHYAAPGTIYFADASSTYGTLLIDRGENAAASGRSGLRPEATELPALGSGPVGGWEIVGDDAWLTGAEFLPRWVGVWVALENASGDLGSFEVVELGTDGRIRLAGAGGASAASTFTGRYRFDAIELRNSAGLSAADPIEGGDLSFDGSVELDADIEAASALVRSGATIRPKQSGKALRFKVSGTMKVEAGAVIDVTGYGYAGGIGSHVDGYAPPGVPASGRGGNPTYAGGSHGGKGTDSDDNLAGDVFGSVYFPGYGGGGGTNDSQWNGGAGGGVIDIEAAELVLQGELRAAGESRQLPLDGNRQRLPGAGAGGTVSIRVDLLSGAGLIDVSGGDGAAENPCDSDWWRDRPVAGGGGRAAIHAATLDGFDPASQVQTCGGFFSCGSTTWANAGPGTVYSLTAAGVYGDLRIDHCGELTPALTPLPELGTHVVGTVDASEPGDLWIEPLDPDARFDLGVTGMWIRVDGADYRIVAESDDFRRIRIEGAAGSLSPGDSFRGIYKFDTVTVQGGAQVVSEDFVEVALWDVDGTSQVDLPDQVSPVITDVLPAAGSMLTSGTAFIASATVIDDTSVAEVRFLFNGHTVVDSTSPYEAGFIAPVVTGDVMLTVEAIDPNGNLAAVSHPVQVMLLPPGDPPALEIACPSAGALLAPGTGLDVVIAASSPEGIERVEVYIDGAADPDHVLFNSPYELRLEAPPTAVDGDTLAVRVMTRNFAGLTAETTFDVRIIDGWVVTGDALLAADNPAYEGAAVVVTGGGTLTIEGAHDLRDLAILDGGMVTHPPTSSTETHRLDVALTGDLFVACGGTIDVAGRGYPSGFSYPNDVAEGAPAGVGGSHGGRGGNFAEMAAVGSLPGRIYGNLFDPADPGAGGGGGGATAGGGVVRLAAGGELVIDGALYAVGGGQGDDVPHGAGGSVRLDATALRGRGTIDASGAGSAGGEPGGGGGRVAFYGGMVESGLLARTFATGGDSADPAARGAAGTIFVRRGDQAFGELIVDNRAVASTQVTELLAVGSGVIDSAGVAGFEDAAADFIHSLAGIRVYLNGNSGRLWPVLSHQHHGQSLDLDTGALAFTGQPGDVYDGLYLFDRVTVRGGARVATYDLVTTADEDVEPGSDWQIDYQPTAELSEPADGAVFVEGDPLTLAAEVDSVFGIVSVRLGLGDDISEVDGPPYNRDTSAPEVVFPAQLSVTLEVVDGSGRVLGDERSVTIENPSGAQVPFACTGDAYLVQNQNAVLTRVDQSVSSFAFVSVGGATGIELNNLGFRSTDGLFYAVELSPGGNLQLVQLDATGTVFGLGRPAGLPSGPRFDAGDVSPDGTAMYLTAHNQPLYRVDLTSLPTLPPVTSVAVTGATGFVFDWAVSPLDGKLYGGDSSHGQLAILDPATGLRSDVGLPGLPAGAGYGGAWFDASGHLFLYQNDGNLYEVDLAGPTVVATQSGPGASRNDGAACFELAPLPAAVELVKSGALDLGADEVANVGDVIVYSFEITNSGGEALSAVTLDDPLVTSISCPSGHPIASLAVGAVETCTASYAITQADVDAGVRDNTATVSSEDVGGNPVSATDSHSELIPDPSAGPQPFACTGDAYLVQNQNAELTRLDLTTSPFTFVPIGGATGTELNNLGFRSTDGLLYAVELKAGGNVQLVQIDATGTVSGLGRPSGLPSGPRFDAGDVSPDGTTMYITTTNQPLYAVDLTSLPTLPPVASVAVTGATGFVFDWAVSPLDGKLYGGDSSHGQLAILDPATGLRSDVGLPGLPAGAGYGGAWFDASGHLFLYQNDGNLYEIDLSGPTVVATQSGPGASRNDGAACVELAPLPAAVELLKSGALDLGADEVANVGDVIVYSFEITNSGGEALSAVTLDDPLVTSISCPSGHPIASLAVGAVETCTASYAITQADVDAGVRDNTATVSAEDVGGNPVSATDSHSELIPDPSAGPQPFACTGDAYLVQNQNAELTRLDLTTSPFTFVPIGGATGTELNNLGFRSTDGLLYAVELKAGGNVQLVQIDATGTVSGLGRPSGLPSGPRFDAGDVSPDGTTMYITTTNQPLYAVDLTSLPTLPPVTSVAVTGATGFVFDWAVSPLDGKLYGGDSSHGQLAILDPATGLRSDVGLPGLPAGAGYGGAWFDASGHLFLYQNDGNLYEIDLSGPTVVATQSGPGASRNDGAACVELAPLPAAVELLKSGALDLGADEVANAGDFITYSFEITNSGGEALSAVTLDDPLVTSISCPSGHPIANLAVGAVETCIASYAITQADVDAGIRDNTATVSAEDGGGNPVTDTDSHSEPIPDPSAGPQPFTCTGDAYLVQNQNAELTRLDQSVSPFVFVPVGGATGTELNNLGFRSTDGLLYAVELNAGGNVQLVQIDATGTVFGLGRPAGLPSALRFDAGDVSPDGTTMYITMNNRPLYVVDLTSVPSLPPVTLVGVTGATGFVFDWAVSPLDGKLYGGDSSHGQLAILDPATGLRSDVGLSGLPAGAGYGGAWFDASGNLFLYQNDGNLYEIDLAGPTVVATQSGPGASRNDGAACAAGPPAEPPAVEILCPSPGALLAPATGLDVAVEASASDGIEKVEFYLGGGTSPDVVVTSPPYAYRLIAPQTAVDGDTLTVRAVATGLGGLTSEASVNVRIIEAWVVDGAAVLSADDSTHEGDAVVVAAGTLTLEGAHEFRDLAVLDGATVTHPPTPEPAVDLPLDGLLGYWPFDDQLEPSADFGGLDHSVHLGTAAGTDANDPAFDCDVAALGPVAGNSCALDFVGDVDAATGDFSWVANAPALDFTDAFTFSAWIRIDEGIDRHLPIFIRGAYDGSTDANDVELFVQAASHDLVIGVNRGNGGAPDHVGFADPPRNTLFHLAVAFDGSTVSAFYDGVPQTVTQGDAVLSPPLATGHDWLLGTVDHLQFDSGFGRRLFFDGLIDEVRLYDRALTGEEISSLAAATQVRLEDHLLDVTLTGDLYVACGGAIDVSGRGYRGGVSYPNTSDEAAATVGGSHGGRGGNFTESELADAAALPGRSYGSLFDPRDPGAGGVETGADAGGGVIHVAALGDLVIDGALRATGGEDGFVAHGAGGSIRLDGAAITGRGTVDASGGGSGSSTPSGGGGRIAFYAESLDADLLARTTATGGDGVEAAARGAAGTVYALRVGDVFGELIVDGGAVASTQITELLAVGTGTVTAVTADGFRSDDADFIHSLAGVQVVMEGDLVQTWPILGHLHHGQSLQIDDAQVAFTAQAGDTYQGLYRFDRVTVRSAQVVTADLILATVEDVEPGSLLEAGYRPVAELSEPADGASVAAGDPVTITAQVDTVFGVAAVRLGFGDDVAELTGEPFTRTVVAAAVSEPTEVTVTLEVVDRSGRVFRDSRTVTVTPATLELGVVRRTEIGRGMPPGILRKDEKED